MQLTTFGLGFIPLALGIALFSRAWLPALLILSATFQATSVLNMPVGEGAFGISPYNLVALLVGLVLATRLLRERTLAFLHSKPSPAFELFVGYFAVSIVGALILPRIFEGTPVNLLIDRHGMDRAPVPLTFTLANTVQAVNLCVHAVVLTFLLQASARDDWRPSRLIWAMALSIGVMFGIGLYERVAPLLEWPTSVSFWMNNPGYIQYDTARIAGILRVAAPMSEASYASTFLAATLAGLAAVLAFGQQRIVLRLVALFFGMLIASLALINTLGTTGWVAGAVSCGAIGVWLVISSIGSPSPSSRFLRSRALVFLGAASIAGMTFGWIWKASPVAPQVGNVVDVLVLKKLDGGSARVRNRSNEHALQIVKDTRGLGVGLGSNRASSFLASLISNTGVIGAFLFVAMLTSLLWRYARAALSDAQRFVATALATATFAMGLAIPDLNLPLYWIFIFLAFLFCPKDSKRNTATATSTHV